ncbi:alpha-glucosidase C-terminal domain-containing protein [Dyadobacter sp. CY326]|uniref:alpha-glucosidase C-terminal domain-containing protein n=1 Tax=Dyadobacter sp. CY326 TaxID=2907300 RepID=UPI001F2DE896|nr:alpha-glucosidase C-terminal domain-containing protein [Dyadobacter sp. CY326]MCE7066992.1 alpha-glucosidase C-terminal domain-containing protein [Dyadobacter sp. CY326]
METIDKTLWATDSYQTAMLNFFEDFKSRPELMDSLQSLIQSQPALRDGDHHWRPISTDGTDFGFIDLDNVRGARVIAWSRILDDQELVCAINLDAQNQAAVYVTIDDDIHPIGGKALRMFSSDQSPAELNVEVRNGKCIRMTIPPRGLVIYN